MRTGGLPRPGARYTRDFDDLVAFLAATMDKSAICRLLRLDWNTVGLMITRVMDDSLDPARLEDLIFDIGVDEVSWRRRHKYLTLVSNHRSGQVVWGAEGRGAATFDTFFDELGEDTSAGIEAVSMDMSAGYAKSAGAEGHATRAVICYDPYPRRRPRHQGPRLNRPGSDGGSGYWVPTPSGSACWAA